MAILAGDRRLLDQQDVEQTLLLGTVSFDKDDAGGLLADGPASRIEFEERERAEMIAALNTTRWNVTEAARQLGISRGALRRRIARAGIRP
jgi:transcriptional regulator of acetoin/glycerol metabolism